MESTVVLESVVELPAPSEKNLDAISEKPEDNETVMHETVESEKEENESEKEENEKPHE